MWSTDNNYGIYDPKGGRKIKGQKQRGMSWKRYQLHNNKNGCDQADMANILGRDSGHGSRLIDYTQDHHSLLSTYVGRFQTSSTLNLRNEHTHEQFC